MGNTASCVHKWQGGPQLLAVAANGNIQMARQILEVCPSACCYNTYVDRTSPLLVAAERGHYRLVQAIVESAVMIYGPAAAKQRCINHTNSKGYSALILACINGHAQCVEALVCNGASPLVLDHGRHSTALHWAASSCRAESVTRLLGSRASFQMLSGDVVRIADIPCFDEGNNTLVKFVDRHNGWGLTALHLAAYKGSVSTVRTLMSHGASLDSRTLAPTIPGCPISLAPGSTALHVAAAAEDLLTIRVLLEIQVTRGLADLRMATNSNGHRPLDVAQPTSNLLLLHVLDPTQPLTATLHQGLAILNPASLSGTLSFGGNSDGTSETSWGVLDVMGLREDWGTGLRGVTGVRGSRGRRGAVNRGEGAPHELLGSMLQKLKLVLSLELVDVQMKYATATAAAAAADMAAADLDSTRPSKLKSEKEQLGVKMNSGQAKQQQQQLKLGRYSSDSASCDSCRIQMGLSAAVSCSSGSEDGDHYNDCQQQQGRQAWRQQLAAQVSALRARLSTLQALLAIINDVLSGLPASAVGAAGVSSSAAVVAAARITLPDAPAGTVGEEGLVRTASGGSSSRRRRRNSGVIRGLAAWRLLGSRLSSVPGRRSSSTRQSLDVGSPVAPTSNSSSNVDSSSGAAAAAAGQVVDEQMLASFITPGTLSSLSAVTKLLVNSSYLSGPQQQQQQQQQPPGQLWRWASTGPILASALADATGGNAGTDAASAQDHGPLSALSNVSARTAFTSDARWAEQEHALLLVQKALKAAQSCVKASRQAASIAASRAALRQRQQEQLADMINSDRRLSGFASRRLSLGSEGGRMRFGRFSIDNSSRTDGNRRSHSVDTGGFSAAPTGNTSRAWPIAFGSPVGLGPALPSEAPSGNVAAVGSGLAGLASMAAVETGSSWLGSRQGGSRGRRHRDQRPNRHHSSTHRRRRHGVMSLLDVMGGALVTGPDQPSASTTRRNSSNAAASTLHTTQQSGQESLGIDRGADNLNQQPVGNPRPQPVATGNGPACFSLHQTAANAAYTSNSDSVVQETMQTGATNPDRDGQDGDNDVFNSATTHSFISSFDGTCAICMDGEAALAVSSCSHQLCLHCAYQLCCKSKAVPLCPFCRQPISGFETKA